MEAQSLRTTLQALQLTGMPRKMVISSCLFLRSRRACERLDFSVNKNRRRLKKTHQEEQPALARRAAFVTAIRREESLCPTCDPITPLQRGKNLSRKRTGGRSGLA